MILSIMTGCTSGARAWAGTYRGRIPMTRPAGMEDAVYNSVSILRVTINPDGTFLVVSMGIPMTGTGSFSGDTASLEITKILNEPVSQLGEQAVAALKPIELQRINGKSIKARNSRIGNGDWVLANWSEIKDN